MSQAVEAVRGYEVKVKTRQRMASVVRARKAQLPLLLPQQLLPNHGHDRSENRDNDKRQ